MIGVACNSGIQGSKNHQIPDPQHCFQAGLIWCDGTFNSRIKIRKTHSRSARQLCLEGNRARSPASAAISTRCGEIGAGRCYPSLLPRREREAFGRLQVRSTRHLLTQQLGAQLEVANASPRRAIVTRWGCSGWKWLS
jgi:hypothetical protein